MNAIIARPTASGVPPALAPDLDRALELALEEKAPATRRAYGTDFRISWCRGRAVSALPATADVHVDAPVLIFTSVLAVLAGWLFFKEKEITEKVIAASVMFCSVLILYLTLGLASAFAMMAATLSGMSIALYATRKPA